MHISPLLIYSIETLPHFISGLRFFCIIFPFSIWFVFLAKNVDEITDNSERFCKKEAKEIKKMKTMTFILILVWFLSQLAPTKNTMYKMLIAPAIINNNKVQHISENTLTLIDQEITKLVKKGDK